MMKWNSSRDERLDSLGDDLLVVFGREVVSVATPPYEVSIMLAGRRSYRWAWIVVITTVDYLHCR